jgi:signal transduction histidine kinase
MPDTSVWPYACTTMDGSRLEAVRRRPLLLDTGMVLLLALLSGVAGRDFLFADAANRKLIAAFGSLGSWRASVLLWWAATAVALGALLVHRRLPVAAFLVAGGMALGHATLTFPTFPPVPADLAAPIALYGVASHARRRGVAVALLVVALGAAFATVLLPRGIGPSRGLTWNQGFAGALMDALVLAVAWFAGDSARSRRAYIAEVERERDQQAQLAAAFERSRITRELHDVIAHGLSLIVIQAQGGQASLDRRQSEQTRQALGTIVTTGRQSLGELRRLLGVVRRPHDAGPELAPQPGLAQLPGLLAQVREAGLPVDLQLEGESRLLPASIDLSAFRILQEALTNTMKHAGQGASATVRVRYLVDAIEVEVDDTGPGVVDPGIDLGTGGDGQGHGLAGMRERVVMLGGRLDTGPRRGGGFRVRAWLPLEVAAT